MKSHFKIFPLFLSFVIIIVSFFQFSFTSFAIDREGDKIVIHDFHDLLELGVTTIGFAYSQCKSIYDGNFTQYISNDETFKNLWTEDNVIVDETSQTITFSEDLTAYMKQALIEYAQEVNGFELIPTTDYHDLSASDFASVYIYHSFRNLVQENGLVAVAGGGVSGNVCNQSLEFPLFLPFDKDSVKNSNFSGAVSLVKASGYNSPYYEKVWFYDSFSWDWLNYTVYDCKTYYNTDEGHTAYKVITSFDECTVKTSGIVSDFSKVGYSYIGWDPKAFFTKNFDGYFLYSTDGRKLKVFNSLNALKNYSVGQRGVYFGSGFYDTPGEIKVSFDDLEKYIDGKYDKFFDDLKDLIGKETDNEDSLSEEDLEKLVDKILGSMNDNGNNDNPGGNTGDNSGILSDILSALSSYFDSVLAYLDSILTSIQGLIYVETVKPDPDDGYDLSDMINDVWEDPENGSQTVADSLSASFSDIGSALMAKFPFCIPNDLYSLFNVFANIPESRAAPMSLEEDGIQTYAESGSAPRFELPLVIESFGVDEVIIIDMEPFTPLSKNARVFLSLIFAVALMKFSAVVIGFINDAWG